MEYQIEIFETQIISYVVIVDAASREEIATFDSDKLMTLTYGHDGDLQDSTFALNAIADDEDYEEDYKPLA